MKVREKDIQKACLELLRARMPAPHGYWWRNNTGAASLPGGTGEQLVRFGVPGSSDLMGVYRGQFWGVEIKVPGRKPTKRQNEWLRAMQDAGAIAFWVDDVGVLDRMIDTINRGYVLRMDKRSEQWYEAA